MNQAVGNKAKVAIKLLVATSKSGQAPSIELAGRRWSLIDYKDASTAPAYTCISYSWGQGRSENPLRDGAIISDRTIPALEAAIRAIGSPVAYAAPLALWIDALCIPHNEPERTTSLSNMGAIYATASQVIVVLTRDCAGAVRKAANLDQLNSTDLSDIEGAVRKAENQLTNHDRSGIEGAIRRVANLHQLNSADLCAIENDGWNARTWTYQEIANAKNIFFVAEGDGSHAIQCEGFLNRVLTDGDNLIGTGNWSEFPNITNFMVTMAEHKTSDYVGRPAFQLISVISARNSENFDDKLYVMLGSLLGNNAAQIGSDTHLVESFISACEEIEDYSFIFCTGPRSATYGQRWLPVGKQLTPVISGVFATGRGLSGCRENTHLRLNRVCVMKPEKMNDELKAKILRTDNISDTSHEVAAAAFNNLKRDGFAGDGRYIELKCGLFFPVCAEEFTDELAVIASEDVEWLGGGPAILAKASKDNVYEFCDVGVFVGTFPGERIAISLY